MLLKSWNEREEKRERKSNIYIRWGWEWLGYNNMTQPHIMNDTECPLYIWENLTLWNSIARKDNFQIVVFFWYLINLWIFAVKYFLSKTQICSANKNKEILERFVYSEMYFVILGFELFSYFYLRVSCHWSFSVFWTYNFRFMFCHFWFLLI